MSRPLVTLCASFVNSTMGHMVSAFLLPFRSKEWCLPMLEKMMSLKGSSCVESSRLN